MNEIRITTDSIITKIYLDGKEIKLDYITKIELTQEGGEKPKVLLTRKQINKDYTDTFETKINLDN